MQCRGVTLEFVVGDIANQPDIEAIVNAANAELRPGGGVAGAIHRAAGQGLEAECRALAPIRPGQAVLTGGHALPNRYVIHCLGPVYGVDEPADQLLASCYTKALKIAAKHAIQSIAFPASSTGVFGYPKESAARVASEAVILELERETSLQVIRFVFAGDEDLGLYRRAVEEVIRSQG